MNIPKNAKFSILKLLEKNGLQKIIELGYTSEQTTQIIDYLKNEGLIWEEEERFLLTEKAKIEIDLARLKKNKDWIQIEKKSKIPSIDKNSIYLPNKDEIIF